jgi:hypothetical protein
MPLDLRSLVDSDSYGLNERYVPQVRVNKERSIFFRFRG